MYQQDSIISELLDVFEQKYTVMNREGRNVVASAIDPGQSYEGDRNQLWELNWGLIHCKWKTDLLT